MPDTPRMAHGSLRAGLNARFFGFALVVCITGCGGAQEEEATTARTAADALCPVLDAERPPETGGLPPSLAEGTATDLERLSAAFPETAGAWARTQVNAMPRGAAGHWSPVVAASYARDGASILAHVDDLVHVCRCASGMGESLRDAEQRRSGGTPASIHGHPALRLDAPAQLLAWVNDRCAVRIAGGVSMADVLEVENAVDWSAIEDACVRR
jgi:hypothetical protein